MFDPDDKLDPWAIPPFCQRPTRKKKRPAKGRPVRAG